jgi:hypothetical protein
MSDENIGKFSYGAFGGAADTAKYRHAFAGIKNAACATC